MKKVCYRIMVEDFAHEPGDRWPVEVLIQTEDPADFRAAVEEGLDRIQERIDRQEDEGEPDPGYLDKLREKLGDSNCGDWDEYCLNVSQPEVRRTSRGSHVEMNMAEVAGRRRMRRVIDRGVAFESRDLRLLRLLERQAAVGKRVVKFKRKRLKPKIRPALTFDCVRIDPRLTEEYGPDHLRGILDTHSRSYEQHDWNPHRDGFTSTIGQRGRPDLGIYCLTVFFDGVNSATFVVPISPGCGVPDDGTVMDLATEGFRRDVGIVRRRVRAMRAATA